MKNKAILGFMCDHIAGDTMSHARTIFATLLLVFFAATSARAVTVFTFSEPGATTSAPFLSSDGLVQAEWVWNIGQTDGHTHVVPSGGNPGAYEDGHGQTFQGIVFSAVAPGPLTLLSFDLRGTWTVGLLNDGTGTVYTAGTEGSGAWITQALSLTASSIYIYAGGNGAGDLDNVVLSTAPVPLPAATPLLGTGLGLLGLVRWFRRRRQEATWPMAHAPIAGHAK